MQSSVCPCTLLELHVGSPGQQPTGAISAHVMALTQKPSFGRSVSQKRDALSELAFSGRHRNHSLWVLTQKYNSVSKDVREQIKWLCLFFTKDRDSFED